jgi:multiple sugar transport system substrate-binding protein
MISKRAILLALATTGMLAGTSLAFAQSTVTMWTFLDPAKPGGREQALKTMIEGFEKENPGIKIKVEPQVWTTLAEKFVLGSNAGNAPDITWVNAENLGLILNTDAAADLAPPIMNKWTAARKSDLLMPKSLEAVTVGGKVLAVPLMTSTWVMMYRKDLFRAAGIDVASISTWDGVTQAAKKLTKDTNGDGVPDVWGIGLGLAQERFSATPAVFGAIGADGGLINSACKPLFASKGGERGVMLQANWVTVDKVAPRESISMTSDDAVDQFAAGRYAMQIISNTRFEQIQRTASNWNKEDLGMAPIPAWTAGATGPQPVVGWYAVAWRKSPRLDAATKFIDYMTSAASMGLWAEIGGQMPMNKSLMSSAKMKAPQFAPLLQAAEFLEKGAVFMPGACNWSRTFADFNLATQQVILGKAPVADALKQAAKATADRQ